MAKFQFRLQKVLEFRANREKAAKAAYLAKRSEVLSIEAAIEQIGARRGAALSGPRVSMDEFRMTELSLLLLDEEERHQKIILNVLNNELEGLRRAWAFQKQELEMVSKLKEKAKEAWQLDEDRKEQAELDEWAVLRRVAA